MGRGSWEKKKGGGRRGPPHYEEEESEDGGVEADQSCPFNRKGQLQGNPPCIRLMSV